MTNTWGDGVSAGSGDLKSKRSLTSKTWIRRFGIQIGVIALIVVGLAGVAAADDDDYSRSSGPQPDVARVSLIHGDVSMQRGDSADWTAATLNTPLVRGDQVATGEKSRAEVQLDHANILRLSSRSQATIADLTRTHIQIQLAQGYANYSMFKGSEAEVEIDTPNVAVRPLKRGRYRIQVNSDDETEVIVRQGEAEITTPQGSTTVKEEHRIIIRGTSQNAEYKVDDAPSGDDWDHFNRDRDRQIQDADSWHHTNGYYTGAHDLDSYGHWIFVPGYGWVWQPWQEANWAPYQAGRWVWEPYWGWTWVSYEPWGWAPYHYGRWFFWGGSWVWWPGPAYVSYRPIWAPAFVTFIGFGHHSGFAFGFGSIGWIPVGPFDPCYPWWGRGFNRVNVVNIVNIRNVTNIRNVEVIRPLGIRGRQQYISNIDMAMRNPRVRAGISGVDTDHFGRGDMRVRRLDVRDTDLRESRVMRGNLPVVPTRESLHAGNQVQPAQMGIQPKQVERFYTKRQPPAGPQPFDRQAERVQRVVEAHTGNAQIPGARSASESRSDFRTQPGVVNNQGANGRDHTTGIATQKSGVQEGKRMPAVAPKQDGVAAQTGQTDIPRQSGDKRDRDGWSKFGERSSSTRGGDRGTSATKAKDNVVVPRERGNSVTTQASTPAGSEDRGGFRKFPSSADRSTSDRTAEQPKAGTKSSGGPGAGAASGSNDRGSDRNADRGGWQRFPGPGSGGRQNDAPSNSGGDRGAGVDRSGGHGSKPPLELNKPIVTPRSTPSAPSRVPDVGGPSRSSEPSRMPEVRSEPRGGGGYDRGAHSGGSSGYDRSGSRSGGGGGGGDRGNRGSERGGGGDKGGSKGSGPKSR
jgi:hypothetical protein